MEINKYNQQAVGKLQAAMVQKFMKEGYCEKYAHYLSYCEAGMYKELSTYLDVNKDVEWTTRL